MVTAIRDNLVFTLKYNDKRTSPEGQKWSPKRIGLQNIAVMKTSRLSAFIFPKRVMLEDDII